MNKKRFAKLSVHQLVDSLLRSGDIDSRVYNADTMSAGSLLHIAYQKQETQYQAKHGKEYLSEYPLAGKVETEEGTVFLQGRADGIILGGSEPVIDEIKSTVAPLEDFFDQQKEWHLGQALCYAFLYLQEKESEEPIGVQLSYISQKNGDRMRKNFVFTAEEVRAKVEEIVSSYFRETLERAEHIELRNESSLNLSFPFEDFRPGQKEFSRLALGAIKQGGRLFCEAPTGIGKTVSALFPAVLSFGREGVERIFYLTAKNTGSLAAHQAVGQLYDAGFKGRDSTLYAKEKICLCPGHACNPDDCPFAKGYYAKVKEAIRDAVANEKRFDFACVTKLARKYGICSFEFQLDLSEQSDIIIADYNYFFDPFVSLKRYFDEGIDASLDVVLVDEAHNMVDRGKNMYSAQVSGRQLHAAIASLKGKTFATFRKHLKTIREAIEPLCAEEIEPLSSLPEEMFSAFEKLKKIENQWQKNNAGQFPSPYRDFRREFGRFVKLWTEHFNANFTLFAAREGEDVVVSLRCLDASPALLKTMNRVKAAVFFSATLSPIPYYMKSIAGTEEDPYLLLPSPFPPENFKVLVAPKVSVRFRDRERSYEEVGRYLSAFVGSKVGNYFLYFPSYKYLQGVRPYLDFPKANVLVQDKKMSEELKAEFLETFKPNPQVTSVGLFVLGGAFSEGIDLQEDRLIGVAVVGVGLPMVCYENDRIRAYYEERGEDGFDFAYRYPGLNKVTQAVGRVIRSESDVGAALLIDDRFLRGDYAPSLRRLWPQLEPVFSPDEVSFALSSFYKKKEG